MKESKNKMFFIIASSILVLLFGLTGCSSCPELDCPKFDCNDCSPKIEYEEKEIIKTEYEEKIVNKYQCFDGSFVENIITCKTIQNLRKSMNIVKKDDLCSDPDNYDLQQIEIDTFLDNLEELDSEKYNLGDFEAWVKWYPSLNEGFILGYPISVNNVGCTKLYVGELSASIYLYHDGELIAKNEKSSYGFEMISSVGGEIYPDLFASSRITFKDNMFDAAHEITEAGDYPVKVIVYYGGEVVEVIEDVIMVH